MVIQQVRHYYYFPLPSPDVQHCYVIFHLIHDELKPYSSGKLASLVCVSDFDANSPPSSCWTRGTDPNVAGIWLWEAGGQMVASATKDTCFSARSVCEVNIQGQKLQCSLIVRSTSKIERVTIFELRKQIWSHLQIHFIFCKFYLNYQDGVGFQSTETFFLN